MGDTPHYLHGRLGTHVVMVFAAAYFLSYAFRRTYSSRMLIWVYCRRRIL
jgi:hypothetical protein